MVGVGGQSPRHPAPITRHPSEGVGNEAFSGQIGALVVAARQALPADVQLAQHAQRRELAVGVEHVELRVGERTAQRHTLRFRWQAASVEERDVVDLGGAVLVQHTCVRQRGAKARDQLRRQQLAAQTPEQKVRQARGWQRFERGQQQPQQRRHQHDARDALARKLVEQRLRLGQQRVGEEQARRAVQQRGEQLGQRDREGQRRALAGDLGLCERVGLGEDADAVEQLPLRHRDPLGLTGRAGGVDDVREVGGADRRDGRAGRAARDGRGVGIEANHPGSFEF